MVENDRLFYPQTKKKYFKKIKQMMHKKITKTKFTYAILSCLVALVLICSGIYFLHRFYFEGAVNTYITAQKIPVNKISNRKVYYNLVDDSGWEESIDVNNYGHKLNYLYHMDWGDKKVILEIYKGHEGSIPKKEIEYPNLSYDN